MKHCLECLVCLLNQNKKQGVNGEVKSSNSLLMKTGYTSLLHFFIISEGDYAGRLEAFYVFRRNNKKLLSLMSRCSMFFPTESYTSVQEGGSHRSSSKGEDIAGYRANLS